MRLAIVTSHPIQYYGPLFRELAKSIDLHVFFAHDPTPQQQADAGFGTAFKWDIDITSGYRHSFLENVSPRPGVDHFAGCDTPQIGRLLREGGFAAVLVFGWHLKSSVQAAISGRRLGLPVIVRGDSHLETPRSPLKRIAKELAYPVFLRLFSAACYVGRRSRAYYEHYHFPKARLFFSPHCIDTEWFADRATGEARADLRRELGIGDDERIVLFAGKLLPFKRPLDVVEACAAVTGRRVHVVVAGSGELEAALRDRAAELGVSLHLLGFRNQSQMPAVYAAADVLMLPSDGRETWGLVCNEALACGTPIVVSSDVGCAEDMADGSGGAVFPLGDTMAAARALQGVLASPPSPAVLAKKSEAYSLRAAAAGILLAMEAVTKKARSGA